MAPGTRVELTVLRRGEQKTIALQLAKLPDLSAKEVISDQ
jgi:S1-C subfamily serine protease